jgi:HSP20 family protein
MPSPVDTEIVASNFTNGFLAVRMAKLKVHETHKIPISDG